MNIKRSIIVPLLVLISYVLEGQNSTFSPYSRFGVGELAPPVFAHNRAMGGAYIALKPDSTMPIFVNGGNPAAYSLIRLTSLEVGGTYHSSTFTGAHNTTLKKWGTNFSYAALGFPIRGNGGACFGIAPYSFVGYETQSISNVDNVGPVVYKYTGNGGLSKAFLGYGIMPFNKRLRRYRSSHLYVPDSLRTQSRAQYKAGEVASKLLSDLSFGFNGNYIFGIIQNDTRVIYPGSALYYNTFYNRIMNLGNFTGNYGAQTALTIDSVRDPKKRNTRIRVELEALKKQGNLSEADVKLKRDSLEKVTPLHKRAFKEKVKLCFGYYGNLSNPMRAYFSSYTYNYVLNGAGQELIRDTALLSANQKGIIRLPLEQGIGIGIKKGERLNLVADFAFTDWQNFKYFNETNNFVRNYRMAIGLNYVPEKYAAGRGSSWKRVNYRLGASYETGYIKIENATVASYFVSAGLGLPVGIGRLSSMVNISVQYGQVGLAPQLPLKENFWRINFGFTFCDRWFQKFRYD